MTRQRRSSRILEKAQTRLAGIQSIKRNLNLATGCSAQEYSHTISDFISEIDAYNSALSALDLLSERLNEKEKQLASYSEKMLLSIAAQYGKDSSEYEKAGGTRKSSIRRRSAPPIEETK
jgi:hypothetical protein